MNYVDASTKKYHASYGMMPLEDLDTLVKYLNLLSPHIIGDFELFALDLEWAYLVVIHIVELINSLDQHLLLHLERVQLLLLGRHNLVCSVVLRLGVERKAPRSRHSLDLRLVVGQSIQVELLHLTLG